jgi:undecaprenyl-diphosphatase
VLAAPCPDSVAPDGLEVTLLAVVQGLTEFLPVSSSGHLVLLEEALGVEEAGLLLPVALHVGTLLAVLAVYRQTVLAILRDLIAGRPRYVLLLLAGSVPAGLAGVLLKDWFEERFTDPRAAAGGLLVTALILLVSDAARRRQAARGEPRSIPRWRDAWLIGAAQAIAILPGISRSGSTIGAGLLVGLNPAEAARFSFMLSVVAIGGAAAVEARGLFAGEDRSAPSVLLVAWGVVVAAVVGWVALKLLLAFLHRGAFLWFAAYCAALGAGYLILT